MKKLIFSGFCLLVGMGSVYGQSISRKLVVADDTIEFSRVIPKNGFMRTYLSTNTEIWDLAADKKDWVRASQNVLICIEGEYKNGKREGLFTSYVIDSAQHVSRFRIGEQQYVNDKLNGLWKTYALSGDFVRMQTFKDNVINGLSRTYAPDGKTILDEREFLDGQSKYIRREYFRNGKLSRETTMQSGRPHGQTRVYYETGILMDEVMMVDGLPNGIRKYFYPNGQLWIEQEMRAGKPWTVIGNYNSDGKSRDTGTLKDGNGSVIFYEENGAVRETIRYKNGVAFK